MSSQTPSSTPTPAPSSSAPTSTTASSTPPPPDTSTSASNTGSASTSSSQSSASSTGSSTTSLSSTSSTEQAPSLSTSVTHIVSTSGNVVVTRTSTAVVSAGTRPVGSATATSSTSGSKPFFQNTGAVAGVFTVVGLIALALIFALVTNIVRRRRAKAFDRELQEATLQAASVPAPAFLDDDDDDGYGRHGSGGAYSSGYGASSGERQLSDLSHGTYGQNPMNPAETYNMRELGPGTGVGEVYDPYAGAAGIGIARARSMKADNNPGNSYGAALADGASPYAAFAGPQGGYGNSPPPLPGAGSGMGGGDPFGATAAQKNLELLEAAGMGSHIAGAGAGAAAAAATGPLSRSQSQYRDQQPGYGYPQQSQVVQRRASQNTNEYEGVRSALERGKSMGSSGHSHEQPLSSASTGATQYYSPGVVSPYGTSMQGQAQQAYNPQPQYQPQQRWSVVNEDAEDAYGGYSPPPANAHAAGAQTAALPNPFAGAVSTDGHTREWDRDSRSSAYSQEEPKRVLKVANE